MSNIERLSYPIGRFVPQTNYTADDRKQLIQRITTLPQQLEELVKTLTPRQLDTPYREGGWTARQVIHHIPDSHMNAYIRCKWTITEATPTIKAYDEKAWAETPEVALDPTMSVNLLKALHIRWTALFANLAETDFTRQFYHPDSKKHVTLAQALASYAWHGEHHLAHLKIIAAITPNH